MEKRKIYGLVGRRLSHSWSVPIHHAFGCTDYRLIELEPEELDTFMRREDIGGLNVTIPYKRAVMPLCDRIDPAALEIGSVNTLVRRGDGMLYAWNTDAVGFQRMAQRAGISFTGKKVVILGSGGASLTAQWVSRTNAAREIIVISRGGKHHYGNLFHHTDADILINATPVGMYPDNGRSPLELSRNGDGPDSAPLTLESFPALHGVLDLIYNPRRTALLLQAEALGIPCSDGLPMLVSQAAAAETHFFDASIPDELCERVITQLRRDNTNIVLIGMPGCGKSAVGRDLARLSGREVIDIDRRIIHRTGHSIPEIFAADGETGFRALEREEVTRAGMCTGKIIVTGGGVVKDIRNLAPLRQNGRIYHLLRDLSKLPVEGRPLSQNADLSAMWAERGPMYERFRDAVVDNDGTILHTAEKIWRDFHENSDT